jgi:hypothetical protein
MNKWQLVQWSAPAESKRKSRIRRRSRGRKNVAFHACLFFLVHLCTHMGCMHRFAGIKRPGENRKTSREAAQMQQMSLLLRLAEKRRQKGYCRWYAKRADRKHIKEEGRETDTRKEREREREREGVTSSTYSERLEWRNDCAKRTQGLGRTMAAGLLWRAGIRVRVCGHGHSRSLLYFALNQVRLSSVLSLFSLFPKREKGCVCF